MEWPETSLEIIEKWQLESQSILDYIVGHLRLLLQYGALAQFAL